MATRQIFSFAAGVACLTLTALPGCSMQKATMVLPTSTMISTTQQQPLCNAADDQKSIASCVTAVQDQIESNWQSQNTLLTQLINTLLSESASARSTPKPCPNASDPTQKNLESVLCLLSPANLSSLDMGTANAFKNLDLSDLVKKQIAKKLSSILNQMVSDRTIAHAEISAHDFDPYPSMAAARVDLFALEEAGQFEHGQVSLQNTISSAEQTCHHAIVRRKLGIASTRLDEICDNFARAK